MFRNKFVLNLINCAEQLLLRAAFFVMFHLDKRRDFHLSVAMMTELLRSPEMSKLVTNASENLGMHGMIWLGPRLFTDFLDTNY